MRKLHAFVIALTFTAVAVGQVEAQVKKVAPSPAPGTMYLQPERIALRDGGFATAERGFMFVPLNRQNPNSGVIGVEVYRFRALPSAKPNTPPIFRLHGGPSFQGFEGSLDNRGFYESQVLPYLSVADYVVVGQRGIGSSRPNTVCERPRTVAWDASAEIKLAAQHEAARRCQEFWKQWGFDLSGLTVMEAAADVDDVRKALGYDKIQIRGGSFGSHWGMAIMRFYPQTVARAVLRGLEGPDHTYDTPTGVLKVLERIGAAADTAAAFKGRVPAGGFFQAYQSVIDKLNRDPVTVTITDTATGKAQTVRVDGNAVGRTSVTAARAWPAHVLRLLAGDYTAAARALLRSGQSGMGLASYYMLDCGSGVTPERARAYRADPAIAYVGDRNADYWEQCPVWPSDNGEAFRSYFTTTIPTVFVQGDWDTSTPIENSRDLQPHFKNLHYVLVKGGSHGAQIELINASPEYLKEILEFYGTGDMTGLPTEVALPPVNWVVPAQ